MKKELRRIISLTNQYIKYEDELTASIDFDKMSLAFMPFLILLAITMYMNVTSSLEIIISSVILFLSTLIFLTSLYKLKISKRYSRLKKLKNKIGKKIKENIDSKSLKEVRVLKFELTKIKEEDEYSITNESYNLLETEFQKREHQLLKKEESKLKFKKYEIITG